jgi:hypothetical protein
LRIGLGCCLNERLGNFRTRGVHRAGILVGAWGCGLLGQEFACQRTYCFLSGTPANACC